MSSEYANAENARIALDAWATSLAQVFESMADQKPEIKWEPAAGPPAGGDDVILWWEQPLQITTGATVWVGAPHSTWEHAGAATLRAAGLETIEAAEARNTWLEILSQSLSALARAVGAILGREVVCAPGSERPPGADACAFYTVSVNFEERQMAPLTVALSSVLLQLISARDDGASAGAEANPPSFAPQPSRTMSLLLDIELPVSISFGKKRLPMKDVLKLTTGSIIELDRDVNEPVEVLVNQCLVARGEVVVVDGNYGVRIQHIASPEERLRNIR